MMEAVSNSCTTSSNNNHKSNKNVKVESPSSSSSSCHGHTDTHSSNNCKNNDESNNSGKRKHDDTQEEDNVNGTNTKNISAIDGDGEMEGSTCNSTSCGHHHHDHHDDSENRDKSINENSVVGTKISSMKTQETSSNHGNTNNDMSDNQDQENDLKEEQGQGQEKDKESPNKKKKKLNYTPSKLGRKGDPRMHKALKARIDNPSLPLFDCLLIGGFEFRKRKGDGIQCDNDNVSLGQRKNQLSRRLRLSKKNSEKQQQQLPSSNSQKQNELEHQQQLLKSSTNRNQHIDHHFGDFALSHLLSNMSSSQGLTTTESNTNNHDSLHNHHHHDYGYSNASSVSTSFLDNHHDAIHSHQQGLSQPQSMISPQTSFFHQTQSLSLNSNGIHNNVPSNNDITTTNTTSSLDSGVSKKSFYNYQNSILNNNNNNTSSGMLTMNNNHVSSSLLSNSVSATPPPGNITQGSSIISSNNNNNNDGNNNNLGAKLQKLHQALNLYQIESSTLMKRCMLSAGFSLHETEECDEMYLLFGDLAVENEMNRLQRMRLRMNKQPMSRMNMKKFDNTATLVSSGNDTTKHFTIQQQQQIDHNVLNLEGNMNSNKPSSNSNDANEKSLSQSPRGDVIESKNSKPLSNSLQQRQIQSQSEQIQQRNNQHRNTYHPYTEVFGNDVDNDYKQCCGNQHVHRLEGKCGHKPILHKPSDGNAHIDFVVDGKIECYENCNPLMDSSTAIWLSKFKCDKKHQGEGSISSVSDLLSSFNSQVTNYQN